MPLYTLIPGQQCGHCGRDLQPGEVIELSERIAFEVRDKLMPVPVVEEVEAPVTVVEEVVVEAAPAVPSADVFGRRR